jgi:DNA-binding CsgD family transcriptional regulator/tetratricopeptide (TPR) repeat protein
MLLEERGVTRRETEVFVALGDRLTDREIAARLYVSERSVDMLVQALLGKLGVADRPELVALAREIAPSHVPATSTLPAPLELLANPATYVGRVRERNRLYELWARAEAGQQLMVVVRGGAGIGKSRFVAELAARVHAAGARVLAGSCFEDAHRPYEPFVQAISDDLAARSTGEARHMAFDSKAAVARVVPELAARLDIPVSAEPIDPIVERAEVFDALRSYLLRVAADGPALLVIEDIHWATATTRDALLHLARRAAHAPLLIVLTTRDSQPDLNSDLSVLLGELAALPGVEELALRGLSQAEVGELLTNLGDDTDPQVVLGQTGGNPLLVRAIAGAHAGESGSSLRALLAHHYAHLDAADVAAIDQASVLGAEFDVDLLAQSLDRPLMRVLESLEHAEAAGLVVASPGRPGTFAFVHALYRTVHYDALGSTYRMRLHLQTATALQRRADDDRFVPELARHWGVAAPIADAAQALAYVSRAAELAERSLALDEAVDLYRRALDIADTLEAGDRRARLDLMIRLGRVLNRTGRPEHRDVLLDAARVARVEGDAYALAEIAWALAQYGASQTPGVADPEFVAIAEEALAGLGDEPTAARARTLAALAAELGVSGDPTRAYALVHEALAIARDLGDPTTLGYVLLSYRFAGRSADSRRARHPTSDELIALGERMNQPIFTILGLVNRAMSLREAGDLRTCDETVAQYAAMLGDRPAPPNMRAQLLLFHAMRSFLAGDLEGADAIARGVFDLDPSGTFEPMRFYAPVTMVIRHKEGRLSELTTLMESGSELPVYAASRALAYSHSGRLADATAVVRPFVGAGFAWHRNSMQWLAAMVLLSETIEMTGDIAAAKLLGPLLEPYSGRIADQPTVVMAPVDFALAQVALAVGDPERADVLASKAASASRARNTPIFLGRELLLMAEARRRFGERDGSITPLVDEALAIADRHGAHLITQDATRYGLVVR